MDRHMNDEKIEVRVTSSGRTLQVVVLNKGLDMIQIVLGEGIRGEDVLDYRQLGTLCRPSPPSKIPR